MSRFEGANGYKPSTEARRYVYLRLATSLEANGLDCTNEGLNEFDRRRVLEATRKVIAELRRKARGAR